MTYISNVLSTTVFPKRKFRRHFRILTQVQKISSGYSRNGRVLGIKFIGSLFYSLRFSRAIQT